MILSNNKIHSITQLGMIRSYKLDELKKKIDDKYVISLGDITVYTNQLYMALYSRSLEGQEWMAIFDQTEDLVTPEMILEDLREKTSSSKIFINPGEVKLDLLSDISYCGLASYNNIVFTFEEFRVDYEGYLDYVDKNISKIMHDWPNFKW